MIKIIILSCIVCWMYLRQLAKSKPDSIWRIKLSRFSRYMLIGIVVWLITIMFGSVKYQIYTDRIFTYEGKVQTVFAWQENRSLPIKALATPVLLSLDYKTVYPMSDKLTDLLVESYPYEPYYLGFGQFLGTLLTFMLLLSYLSRHRHTDRKWQYAMQADSKLEYENFTKWSHSKLLRHLHCKGMEKKIDEAVKSINQRGLLKLQIYRESYLAQGLNSAFLDMLNEIVRSGHHDIVVKAEHNKNYKPISESTDIEICALNSGALEPKLFMEKYFVYLKSKALAKDNLSDFDSIVLNSPEHLRFTYPEPHIANNILEKQLVGVFNQGRKRFVGEDIVDFHASSVGIDFPRSKACLEINYMCQLDIESDKRRAGIWGSELSHKKITMDGTQFPSGSMLLLVFGMSFNWRLVIDGVEISSGNNGTLPDPEVCMLSLPEKQHLPTKSDVENKIFEVVALSNISAFFAQLMGVNKEDIDNHVIDLKTQTALDIKANTEKSNQLTESLEKALRGEALEDLMKSSAKELYLQNKTAVDAVIHDHIQSHGDMDTALMIVDLLGDAVPELSNILLDIIGGEDA